VLWLTYALGIWRGIKDDGALAAKLAQTPIVGRIISSPARTKNAGQTAGRNIFMTSWDSIAEITHLDEVIPAAIKMIKLHFVWPSKSMTHGWVDNLINQL
jgi:hypothetical protein